MPKEAEALFAVAPDDFVEERKRTARSLRDDGRREDADAVAALKKPPPVVLAANRAARDRPQAARAAAKSAERVGKTQLGSNPDAYRAALAELDESLDLLAEVALAHLSTGKPPTESVTRRLRALLRNAVADESARKKLARGLLREEPESAGFNAFAGVSPSPRAGGGTRKTTAADTRREREKEKRREREHALREELDEAEQTLGAAQKAERDATRAREAAERTVESLRTRLERPRRVD